MGVLSIGLSSFFDLRSRVPRDLDLGQRNLACNALRLTAGILQEDALPQPDGKGCISVSNAVFTTLRREKNAFVWRLFSNGAGANGFVHLNPDWSKWSATATDENAFAGELAAYCSPRVFGTDGSGKVFIGMSFGQKFVQLTNPPSWPRAVDLVQQ